MKEINFKKGLKKIIREYPHELDKIEKVMNDAKENGQHDVQIEFSEIIKSNIWNSDEKVRLLTICGYNTSEHEINYNDEHNNLFQIKDYLYTIKCDIFSGFEALMKIYKDIEHHYLYDRVRISRDCAYRNIFKAVLGNCQDENKGAYIKVILDNLKVEDIKRLIMPLYRASFPEEICNESVFIDIIASKNLDLIKKYMTYIGDLNMYLSEAIATGDIEIVQLFLDRGVDINYLTDEVILGRLSPLKTAISNNDYEMFQFLNDHGANINLQVNCDDFVNRLNNYQINLVNYGIELPMKPIKKWDKQTIKQLRYIRSSSLLEYAIQLADDHFQSNSIRRNKSFNVIFKGDSHKAENRLHVNVNNISEQVRNRGKIVDLIFDKLEDKVNINYTDLIGFTFITRDAEKFRKYTKYAIDYNYSIDFNYLFQLYLELYMQKEQEMSMLFMDFIAKYDKDSTLYLKFFQYYWKHESRDFRVNGFKFNDFNRELLSKISEEKRKSIVIVPYCKEIESLQQLLSLGFNINQTDKKGRNILYYLLCIRYRKEELKESKIELFNYLLENLNLSMRDHDNKTMLYYAMQEFSTEGEYVNACRNHPVIISNLERSVVKLISKMSKQDVCDDDIKKVLKARLKGYSDYGDWIVPQFFYQYHKGLFDALIVKEFLDDEIREEIFKSLYPQEEQEKKILLNSIDLENTLNYLYQILDRNGDIQVLDIDKEYKNIIFSIDHRDLTFEQFLDKLTAFNDQILCLKLFYENNIKKKLHPEKYLQYAKEKYNTIYENLDDYLLLMILKALMEFGNEKLIDILNSVPNYNINHFVVEKDIGYSVWNYVALIYDIIGTNGDEVIYGNEHFEAKDVSTDFDDNIVFTGGLMQYAYLIDNLPMVQHLQKKGGNFQLLIDGKDHTWDYINSHTMMNYIVPFVGENRYSDLNIEEKNKNIDHPKTLALKKDNYDHL